MTLRRVDNYATNDPDKLSEQLSRLEDNIDSALGTLLAQLTWTDWVSSGRPQLAFGRITRVDTSTLAISATLPSISAGTAGQLVGVKRKGTNAVTLWPVESTALIDGASSATLGADGLYLYIHDGVEWSKV